MPLPKHILNDLKALQKKKTRGETGLFIVEGLRLTSEAASSDFEITGVYHTREFAGIPEGDALLQRLRKKTRTIVEASGRELSAVSDTVTAPGILAVLRQRRSDTGRILQKGTGASVLVGFDSVSDPGNLGSMIRTCDWFGINGILHGNSCVELYNPKVVRATMGGLFHVPVAEEVDLLPALSAARSVGFTVYAADASGEAHFDQVRYANRSVIVFGNEAWGLSDQVKELADVRVSIRRYGAAESLNVGVACGIVLSAIHRLNFD
jgi:RNA methyltransferase, TrmH family